ncbi:hypothetical protein [Hathewaya limosa]|uniref:Uncharacterized protein n=1 Tax=Hathewaya limosa TaxID=1536 RepID=A0ABU0JT32_HATLI|nr:hypothetical protein [Hathewaya limosa]MDQ0480261.1 hypothetical protein [Hathewaya limosa]
MTQQAAETFAKPDTYMGNRTLYDSGAAKINAKRTLFKSGGEVIDPYTGDKLVLTKKEAKKLYRDEWTKHLAESDHVKPLEQIYKDTKGNAWNTMDDIKSAASSDDNIRVASRKFNNSKRSRTNKDYVGDEEYLRSKGVEVTEEGRKQAIQDGELAEQSINNQLRSSAVKNLVKTGHEAGKVSAQNSGVTALTMGGIMNIVSVVKGEKSGEEGITDTIKDGGKAAVTGYAMGSGLTVVSHLLSNSSSQFVQSLAKSNVPGKVITAVIATGDNLKRWGEGEITTQQCLLELGDKGLNMATMGYSMALGQALIPIPIVGGAVGALVGSMLTSTYYNNLINTLQTRELEHQERMRIIDECRVAAEQTKAFRAELESYLDLYFKEYRECFDTALSTMRFAYQSGDAEEMIASANQITRKLGGQVNYETIEEFKSFLKDDSIDIL